MSAEEESRGAWKVGFRAPSFYERHGFEVLAAIEEYPRGHRNLLMRKRLPADS